MKNKDKHIDNISYGKAFIINDDTGEQRMYLVISTDDQIISITDILALMKSENIIYDADDLSKVIILAQKLRGTNCIIAVDKITYSMPQFLASIDLLNQKLKFYKGGK